MEEPILEAEGVQARIELLQDRVLIKGKGFMAKPGGDKDIPIRSIASVELVSPTRLDRGYIQFVLGGQEPRTGFWARSQDPYTVQVRYSKKTQFEELQQAIEQRIAMRQGPAEPPPASVSPGTKEFKVEEKPAGTKEFEVEGEPTRILTMLRGYFNSDEWPYHEKSKVIGPDLATRTRLTCVVDQPYNPIGCIVWLALFVVTLGAAILLWLYWVLVEREGILPQVIVTAYPESPGVSRVTLAAEKKPEYAEPVAAWIQRELVENKRAVETPQQTPPPPIQESLTPQQPTSSANSGDIPDQLRKLAELRDAGVISEGEFETKKRDLLDRM